MTLDEVPDDEIRQLRVAYTQELRRNPQASASVKRMWKIVIAALDEVVERRNGGRRTVLNAREMTPPGSEPLA